MADEVRYAVIVQKVAHRLDNLFCPFFGEISTPASAHTAGSKPEVFTVVNRPEQAQVLFVTN